MFGRELSQLSVIKEMQRTSRPAWGGREEKQSMAIFSEQAGSRSLLPSLLSTEDEFGAGSCLLWASSGI